MAAAKFNYIGYGPNNDPDMIEAICGPGAILKLGGKVTMLNTQLCVARLDQTPREPVNRKLPSVHTVLSNAWVDVPDFEFYGARRKDGHLTDGTVMALREKALNAIWGWELVELGWFEEANVRAMKQEGGGFVTAQTELLPAGAPIDRTVDGQNYENFLMPKEIMMQKAVSAREA